jgi:hypothetical protein
MYPNGCGVGRFFSAETHPDIDNESVLVSIGPAGVEIGCSLFDGLVVQPCAGNLLVDCCGYRYSLGLA